MYLIFNKIYHNKHIYMLYHCVQYIYSYIILYYIYIYNYIKFN